MSSESVPPSVGQNTLRIGLIIITLASITILFSGGAAAYQPPTVSLSDLEDGAVFEDQTVEVDVTSLDHNGTVYLHESHRDGVNSLDSYSPNGGIITVDTEGYVTGIEYGFASNEVDSEGELSGVHTLVSADLGAGWESSTATDTEDELGLELNSGLDSSFPITISAEGFSYAELKSLFGDDASITTNPADMPLSEMGYSSGVSTQELKDAGYITLTDWDDDGGEITANFNRLYDEHGWTNTGERTFDLIAGPTGATDEATIEIAPAEQGAEFENTEQQPTAGDVADFTVELSSTSQAFIQFGGPSVGFADVLYVDVGDEDGGEVSISVNTRLAGTNPSLSTGDVYHVEGANTVVSAFHSGSSGPFRGTPTLNGKPIFGDNEVAYPTYISESGISSADAREDVLDAPLATGEYPIYVAGVKNINPSEEGVFDADTGKPTDNLAESTVTLTQPTVDGVNIYTASEGDADVGDTAEGVLESVSPTDTIARGDRLIVEFDVTGVYGGILAGPDGDTVGSASWFDNDPQMLIPSERMGEYISSSEGMTLKIEGQGNAGNSQPVMVNFDTDEENAIYWYANRDQGTLVTVINTASSQAAIEEGFTQTDRYKATLRLAGESSTNEYTFTGGNAGNGAFSSEEDNPNYPNIPVGESEAATTEFTIEEPSFDLDSEAGRDAVVENKSETTISGSVNVAPSNPISLVISENDLTILRKSDIQVDPEGRFSTTVDLQEEQAGKTLTLTVERDNTAIGSQTLELVADKQQTQPTDSEESQSDPEESESNSEESESNSGDDSTDDETQLSPDDSTGGSGVTPDDQIGEEETTTYGNTSDDGDSGGSSSSKIPGFGIVSAIIAIATTLVAARRRRR
jgi:PGF-CTERM protein